MHQWAISCSTKDDDVSLSDWSHFIVLEPWRDKTPPVLHKKKERTGKVRKRIILFFLFFLKLLIVMWRLVHVWLEG